YTLALHDALPICLRHLGPLDRRRGVLAVDVAGERGGDLWSHERQHEAGAGRGVGAERHVLAVTLELALDLVVPGCGRGQRDGPVLPRRDADLLVHGVAGLIEQEGSGEISARRADGPVEGDLETARVLLAQRDALDHRGL